MLGLVLFGALLGTEQALCLPTIDTWECASDVRFHLINKNTSKEGTLAMVKTLNSQPFISDYPLVILIHGLGGNQYHPPNKQLVPEYLKKGGYNILIMNWGMLTSKGSFFLSVYRIRRAAECGAKFLQHLNAETKVNWVKKTHIIGYSLGTHVAGMIGRYLGDQRLHRVTALEPPLPMGHKVLFKLDKSVADFVDVYHTNGGKLGRIRTFGHVDFYFNNGREQPGCSNSDCNHLRAVLIFAESINSEDGFYGVPCSVNLFSFIRLIQADVCTVSKGLEDSRHLAGQFVDHNLRGTFRISTYAHPPYAKG